MKLHVMYIEPASSVLSFVFLTTLSVSHIALTVSDRSLLLPTINWPHPPSLFRFTAFYIFDLRISYARYMTSLVARLETDPWSARIQINICSQTLPFLSHPDLAMEADLGKYYSRHFRASSCTWCFSHFNSHALNSVWPLFFSEITFYFRFIPSKGPKGPIFVSNTG
jgi:hypothetical protein